MRIRLNVGWEIRPIQTGFELVAPEHNITLEMSDFVLQNEFMAVLRGEKEIPVDNEAMKKTLQQLEHMGVVSQTEESLVASLIKFDQIWRIRREFVGPNGPITSVYWLDPAQSRLSIAKTHLFTAKYREGTSQGKKMYYAWASGSDVDWEKAEFKAVMEALERHACGIIPKEQLIKTTARKLGDKVLDPRKIVAYTARQYRNGLPFTPFSYKQEYWWKSVVVLPEGYEKYVPIECLYYPVDKEFCLNPYTAATSSGVAAGLTFEDALLRAIYEAIERDAFMFAWLSRTSMPRIDRSTIPADCHERIYALESLGYCMHFVDITLGFVPVVLAVGVSNKTKPALVLGAAADSDIRNTFRKALSEVEHQLYWEWRDPEHIYSINNPKKVRGVLDHKAFYASPERLPKASFLWSGETKPMKEAYLNDQNIFGITEELRQQSIETVVVDLTPAYLKQGGIWVIRAIPLGLLPISFGYGMEPLGMARYKGISKKANSRLRSTPSIHPFS